MEWNNKPTENRKPIFKFYLLITFFITLGFGFAISKTFFSTQQINEIRTEGNAYIDFVSGTEYISNVGEQGQMIVRVSDYSSNPLSATCNATIIYPNKTIFISNQSMMLSSIQGNYYITFSVPSISGIYEDYAICDVAISNTTKTVRKSSSFHISPIYELFANISNQITDLNQSVYNINGSISNQISNVNISISNQISQTNSSLTNLILNVNTTIGNVQTNIENFLSAYLRAFMDAVGTISSGDINSILDSIFGTISPIR